MTLYLPTLTLSLQIHQLHLQILLFGAAPRNLASLILAIRTTRMPGIPRSIPTQTSPSTRMILRDNFLTEFYNNKTQQQNNNNNNNNNNKNPLLV
jgi:hypothetical protein